MFDDSITAAAAASDTIEITIKWFVLSFTLHKCIGWIYKKLLEFEDKNSL